MTEPLAVETEITSPPPKFCISVNEACACFAFWAIYQSPYTVPDQLEEATEHFKDGLIKKIMVHAPQSEGLRDIIFIPHDSDFDFDGYRLSKIIDSILLSDDFKQTKMWNEPKNQDRDGRLLRRYYLNYEHPDDDFIDIHALSRNISNDLWKRGGYEEEKEKYSQLNQKDKNGR